MSAGEKDPLRPVVSERQRQILDFMRRTTAERGFPPTVREIGEAVGLASPSSVSHHLRALERLGQIRRDPNLPRAVVIAEPQADADSAPPREPTPRSGGKDWLGSLPEDAGSSEPNYAPVLGRIAAGGPILAEQSVEAVLPLPRDLVGDGQVFLLHVVGDSMIDAAICDGDWVAVRSQPTAENGEIVAALLDDEATVKVLKRTPEKTWLLPQNSDYEPIDGDNARIVGKVVAVLRRIP